jgi:heptosyltransferase-1
MEPLHQRQKILLIRLGSFGDVVFTLPAVHLVRASFPTASITFLVYNEYAPLLQGFPGINRILTLDRARYRTFNPVTICSEAASLLGGLLKERFELSIDFQGFGETAWLSWLTGAPERWGSVYRSSRRWAYTRPVMRNSQLHPVAYHLDLLRQAGGLVSERVQNEFVLPPTTLDEARRFFAEHNLDPDRPTLFIQPFTSGAHKTWPLSNFLSIAQDWRKRGLQVLFGGGPADRSALEPVRQAGFAVAAGSSPLLSASLVKLSSLILGADTGLLHLAAAMNKRVVMLIPSIHPGACIPFGHPEWALAPLNGSSVASLTPDSVSRLCAQALLELGLTIT